MQLCQNKKTYSKFFSLFPESTKNLEYFENKDEPNRLFVSEIIECKRWCYLNA